jgi:mannan endo-1,4-beta-mannosidase
MKTRIGIAVAALAAVVAAVVVAIQPAQAAVGIRVSGGQLVEGNGTPLKLRGINHAHTWYTSQTSSFANIKAAGANSVRVVLSGGRWQPANNAADVANVINLCKTNRLICVLENHDTTGFGEQGGSVSLDAAVDYWISVQSALTGQENYVILNIGNEPVGNNAVSPNWTQATISAVQRLRNAGFQHTVMVDAPNWGQDWQFQMRDNAPQVLAADATGNLIFSIHMYGVFDTTAEVNAYVDSFTSRNLALCICEFGDNHSDGNPNEDAIMAKAQSAGIGMMGWSWSGNGGGVEYLDMVTNFNPAQRSNWGNRFITGTNGLSTTSQEATIYSGTGGDTTPPSTPGTPTATDVTSSGAGLSWAASTDTGGSGLAGYNVYRELGANDQLLGQPSGNSITLTGLSASTSYQVYVRARDGAGNLSANSGLASFTTTGTGGDTQPPTTPGTPTASNVTASSVSLSWSASSDNVAVTGYDIFRAPGASGGSFASVGTATATAFTNTGLTAATTYRYQVRARDAAGNTSAFSNPVTVTTTTDGGGGCSASYTNINQWPGGFQGEVRVTNNATTSTTAWTVTMTFANGQRLTQIWGGRTNLSGASPYTVTNETWNANIGPAGTTAFGFLGSWNATNTAPTLTCTRTP